MCVSQRVRKQVLGLRKREREVKRGKVRARVNDENTCEHNVCVRECERDE